MRFTIDGCPRSVLAQQRDLVSLRVKSDRVVKSHTPFPPEDKSPVSGTSRLLECCLVNLAGTQFPCMSRPSIVIKAIALR
ncbi:hypothetical protein MTP99_000047 [Tenebrio molitor]|nr:hypothetical protein MTP99_000047 [Tenebrio molitor]